MLTGSPLIDQSAGKAVGREEVMRSRNGEGLAGFRLYIILFSYTRITRVGERDGGG